MCTQPANFPAEENLDFAVIVLHRSLTLGPLNQVGHRCKTLLTFDNFSCSSEWRPGGADDPVWGRRRVGWTKLEGSWTPGDERRLSARKICGLCRFSLFVLCPFIHSIKMVSYWWWFLKAPDLELSKDDTLTHRKKDSFVRPGQDCVAFCLLCLLRGFPLCFSLSVFMVCIIMVVRCYLFSRANEKDTCWLLEWECHRRVF